jgi:hypothetical protein
LLEILMVLAVFVMVTALAMPAVNRAYVGQQLIGAADVVRARFAEARVQAIESGDIYGFFYQPGAGDYFIAPMVQGFQSIRNGVQPVVREDVLKNNIQFVEGETLQDARSLDAVDRSDRQFGSMRPVLFYPDGTSQDAVVLLRSPRSTALMQVELRGLTGTSTRSDVLEEEEAKR